NIDPRVWEITQGTSSANADEPDSPLATREQAFGSSRSVDLTLAPRTTTIVTFKLKAAGVPYWQRPDLGISREDVQAGSGALTVKVHNLGSVPSPETVLALRDHD